VDRDEKLTDEMKLTKQTVKECQAAIDAERKKIERLRNAPAANDVKLRTLTDERKMLEEEVKEIEPALDEVVTLKYIIYLLTVAHRDESASKPKHDHCKNSMLHS
jgi:chromosome segregation ATPase